jgi:outer membrane lipoprotein-sorting protein
MIMERLEDKNQLDEALTKAIGSEGQKPDFEKWKQEHPEAVEMLTSRASKGPSTSIRPLNIGRIIMKSRFMKLAAAAVIIVAVLICINQFGGDHSNVFAHVLEHIEKAKTITWKTTFYAHVTSKDGTRTWVETETREHAYKAPDLYRNVYFDENGQITHWTIRNAMNREELSINPGEKTATFRELDVPMGNPRGPFVWHHEQMQKYNLELVGKGETETGEANIFRAAFRDKGNNRDYSYDFWIDAKTKKLVAVHVPGSDIYDPENDPARLNPPHKDRYSKKAIGYIQHDIIYDADLDESIFSLEPPEGYTVKTVETKRRIQVTEKEMIEYLGIMADYNNKTFPDQLSPYIFTTDRTNKIWEKAEGERTAAEQKFIETESYYMGIGLTVKPTYLFVKDHTVKDSFRYIGKGAKLGDKERIVCWYKLKGSNTYRAVYGDLSVRDVALEDLPLPVEP